MKINRATLLFNISIGKITDVGKTKKKMNAYEIVADELNYRYNFHALDLFLPK